MANKKISLLILAAFVVGMLMLIYVHFIFSKNNDQLISGNQKLMEEVTVSSQLKDLEKYVISMESIDYLLDERLLSAVPCSSEC